MLPEPLFNTYTQYKSDTLRIATWLASTARRCGYTPPPEQSSNSANGAAINGSAGIGSGVNGDGVEVKPQKLKGRARKLAKEAAVREAKEAKGREAETKRLKREIEERTSKMQWDGDGNAEADAIAVAAAAESGKEVEKKPKKKYVIQLREFVPMAESIARAASDSSKDNAMEVDREVKPKVKISTGLIKLFRRCIRARTGTNEWYEKDQSHMTVSERMKRSKDDDDGHGHFINVLRQALGVLVPVHELQELEARNFKIAKAEAAGSEQNGEILKVTNAYGQLEIEETDEDAFEALPNVVFPASDDTPDSEQKVKYEVEDDGSEWLFALHSLWGDIHEIQHYLKRLWLTYSEGKADLSTASVVTNTAIDLIRRAEEDFNNAGLKLPEPWKMDRIDKHLCSLYFMEACIRDSLDPPRESREYMVPLSAWDQVEESFLLVYRQLSSSHRVGKKTGPVPITRESWMGTFDPALDRDKASIKRLYEQDSGLLSDMIVTLGPYVRLGNTPNDDELMKGMRDHLGSGSPPLWLVFAGQVFVDIHSMLKTKGDQPFKDLHDYSLEARRTLRGHNKFFEKHATTGFQTEQSDRWIRDVHEEIETWALNDKILHIFNDEMSVRKQLQNNKRSGSKKVRAWKENEILKMHPLLCGMWKYCFELQMQSQGIRLVNETMIMAAVHLYNALQQCGYIPEDCLWVDAEYLLDIHADANTFLGERPKTIEECTKRLAISQGISPTTFARGRRTGAGNHRVVFSKTGSKFLRRSTPVASVFTDRFLQNGNVDLSLGNIETILGRRIEGRRKQKQTLEKLGLDKNTLEGRNKLRELIDLDPLTKEEWEELQKHDDDAAWESDESESSGLMTFGPNESHKRRGCACGKKHDSMDWEEAEEETLDRWEKEHKLSLCDFLSELCESLNEEELDVEFDYFAFHRSTWRLLEAIQETCLPLVIPYVEDFMVEALQSDEGTTVVPGLIMLAACDPRQNVNIMPLKSTTSIDDRGLVAAAEIMKDFIKREGASYSKREKMRLIKKRDLEWRSGDAAGLGEGGFSGAVGNIAHMSVEESARVLQGMTLEDAWTRADQKIANEKEEKKKAKNKKKKKKAKKPENVEGADGGKVGQEQEKENMQPQVEDESA